MPENLTQERTTILVVEDNPVERQLVTRLLRSEDFEVIAVDCGGLVMDTVIDNAPDLILLDARLPDVDGFDVCEQLRAHSSATFIPIIMLTGLDDMASINRAYDSGATDFFSKPINHTLLLHRIRYLLRTRQMMDRLHFSEKSLANAQRLGRLGYWEYNLITRKWNLSDELFRIHQLDPDKYDHTDSAVILERVNPEDVEYVRSMLAATFRELRDTRFEHRIQCADGGCRYIEAHTVVVKDENQIATHILGISIDVSERKSSELEILRLAYCDRLTDLPNRYLLECFLAQAIPSAHDCGGEVAMLGIDLDLFNRINNSMGPSAGDAILCQLAERLQSFVATVDIEVYLERLSMSSEPELIDIHSNLLCRLSADTFLVAVANVNREWVDALAQYIRDSFQQPFDYKGCEIFVTASIGVAYSESTETNPETLIQRADLAMHEAKQQGRNCILNYNDELAPKLSAQLSLQNELRRALEVGEFQLVYQPKIELASNNVSGFEALVRWYHPTRGMVPPDQFIPIAEDTGQIVELGAWVLQTACLQNQRWRSQGMLDVRIAVNVSARQFKEGNLDTIVAQALGEADLPATNLELEITEGVIMSDMASPEVLSELRSAGVTVALDDFGTGYSSLSYITRFPIDTIKVDRCFVQDISPASDKAAIVAAITGLSHGLNIKVVAEGVETAEELELIRQLNCDEVQGYYYGKPMSSQEVTEWLRSRRLDSTG